MPSNNNRYDNEGPSSQWGREIQNTTTRLDERVRTLEEARKADKEESKKWVTQDQFWLTRNIAVGLAAMVLVFCISLLLARVIGR